MKVLVFISLIISTSVYAQSSVTADERKAAGEYFTASDWVKAEAAYRSIAAREPKNAGARMRLGQSLIGLKKYNDAISALEESNKLAPNPQAMYSLASAYAAIKNADKSFASLDQAITAGFGQRQTFRQDINFDPIKSDPRYKTFADRFDKSVEPCKFLPEARQFDFWIGDWDALGVNGQPAGKSHIEIMLGDCVIYENWTSALPNEYAGKSLNFFNTTTKKWQQTWVDDKGGIRATRFGPRQGL